MSTTITPTEQNIEINVNNDVIDINVTNEIVDVNATTQQIDINVAGAYPIPNPVLSVFGRTGVVVATEGDYTLTQLGDVTLSSPSNGQVLKYNGTNWVNSTDADTGITTLNTLTALSQTFATGTSGTDFNIASATSTHTFNLPTASAINRGLLSSTDWTTFNNKQDTITNPVTGTGTANTIPLWNASSNITNSVITQVSGNIRVGSTTQTSKLNVGGDIDLSGVLKNNGAQIINVGSGSLALGDGTGKLNTSDIIVNTSPFTITIGSSFVPYAFTNFGSITGGSFIRRGGTSSQFLKADGSVDSTAYGTGSVTSVAALTIGSSGTDLSSTVANSTTTPVITLNVPTASATNRGALSSADWTTFNNKQNALTNPITGTGTSGQVAYWNGTNTQTGSNNLFWDNTNGRLGIGTATPSDLLQVEGNIANPIRIRINNNNASGKETLIFYQAGVIQGWIESDNAAKSISMWGYQSTSILTFGTNNTERARIFANGNFGINTTTDAGFRLDVNGTARVQSFTTINAAPAINGESALLVQPTTNNSTSSALVFGIYNNATVNTITSTSSYTGIYSRNSVGATLVQAVAVQGDLNISAGTTSTALGFTCNSAVLGTGTASTFVGYNFTDVFKAGSGAVGRQIGIRIMNLTAGSTANVGLLFNNALNTSVSGTWDIYSQSGNRSYFEGDIAIGTNTLGTATKFTLGGSETASSAIARGGLINTTLVAAANNDVLVGLDINPTFTNGAFTGVQNIALRTVGSGRIDFNNLLKILPNGGAGSNAYIYTEGSSVLIIQGQLGTNIGWNNNANTTWSTTIGNGGSRTAILGLFKSDNVEIGRVFNTGNVLLQNGGTFTDAGFRLDVNGSTRVQNNLQADSLMYFSSTSAASIHLGGVGAGSTYFIIRNFTGVSNSGIQRVNGTNQPVEFFQRGSTTNEYVFRFSSTDGRTMGNGVNGINDYIRIGDFTYNTPTTNNYTGSILNINPTYNITANTGTILRGIYYNPALTSLTGTTHIAFQNTSGDVLLGTTSGSVGIGANTSINASAILDITSTTKGVLISRMTSAQRTAISSPATGLLVYQTDGTEGFYVYSGGSWKSLTMV